jgi:hypothetical protein
VVAVLSIATAGCGGEDAPAAGAAQPVVLGTVPAHPDPHARTTMVESAGEKGTRLVVVDLATGRRRVIARSSAVRGGDVGLARPAFSPSGDQVAAASATQSADGRRMTAVIVAPVDGRNAARRVPGVRLVDVDGYRPVWTPDGGAIAVPHADGDGIDLIEVRSGRRRALLSKGGNGVAFARAVRPTPSTSLVASGSATRRAARSIGSLAMPVAPAGRPTHSGLPTSRPATTTARSQSAKGRVRPPTRSTSPTVMAATPNA